MLNYMQLHDNKPADGTQYMNVLCSCEFSSVENTNNPKVSIPESFAIDLEFSVIYLLMITRIGARLLLYY